MSGFLAISVSPSQFFAAPAAAVDAARALAAAARERVLLLDGAMGTQIQGLGLDEAHFRGERFVGCDCAISRATTIC